jgi:hypothetical protein
MVVLARSLGLPARLVNGFAGGHENPVGGFVEVARSDAHAWVEVHYRDLGWVRYDPTPPDLRMAASISAGGSLAALASAFEFWWFRNVVDFDRGHQARALKKAWLAWRDWRRGAGDRREHRPARVREGWELPDPPRWLWGVGALVLGLGGLAFDLRRRQRRQELPRFYEEALRLLGRRGLVRDPATTARAFAATVAERLSPAAARSFAALTEFYLAERFGGRLSPAVQAELRAFRDSLRR